MNKIVRALSGAAALAVTAVPSFVSAQSWTNWTSATTGVSATGMAGSLGVTYTGAFDGYQLANGIHSSTVVGAANACAYAFFTCMPAPYTSAGITGPQNNGFIQNNGSKSSASGTVSFSESVHNPLVAFVSVGRLAVPITYRFVGISNFTVLSSNLVNGAPFGTGFITDHPAGISDGFIGNEFSGVIQLNCDFTSFNIEVMGAENWHGFSVGYVEPSLGITAVVPEPSSYAMMGAGLLAVGIVSRRRRKV